jgi:hypothetical protein
MRWAGHVVRTGTSKGPYKVLVGKPEGKRPLGRPRRNGRIILKLNFKKQDARTWIGLIWLIMRAGGGLF